MDGWLEDGYETKQTYQLVKCGIYTVGVWSVSAWSSFSGSLKNFISIHPGGKAWTGAARPSRCLGPSALPSPAPCPGPGAPLTCAQFPMAVPTRGLSPSSLLPGMGSLGLPQPANRCPFVSSHTTSPRMRLVPSQDEAQSPWATAPDSLMLPPHASHYVSRMFCASPSSTGSGRGGGRASPAHASSARPTPDAQKTRKNRF